MRKLHQAITAALALGVAFSALLGIASIWFPYDWHIGCRRANRPFTAIRMSHASAWLAFEWQTDAHHVPDAQSSAARGRLHWTHTFPLGCHAHLRFDRLPAVDAVRDSPSVMTATRLLTCPAWLPLAVLAPFLLICGVVAARRLHRQRSRHRNRVCLR